MKEIVTDYDIDKMREYLLHDKYNHPDTYRVINDDRMWHAIALVEIYSYSQ